MKRVWKYTLAVADEQDVEMPKHAVLLAVGWQPVEGSRIPQAVLWALVETTSPLVDRRIRIAGTGHDLDSDAVAYVAPYVGTFQFGELGFVGHVFDEGEVLTEQFEMPGYGTSGP